MTNLSFEFYKFAWTFEYDDNDHVKSIIIVAYLGSYFDRNSRVLKTIDANQEGAVDYAREILRQLRAGEIKEDDL